MIDKNTWHAVATYYGAAVMSRFRTICRIDGRDMLAGATAIEQAQEIVALHNNALVEITAGALALAQQEDAQ